MAELLTADFFEPYIGKRFALAAPPLELTLIRIDRFERYRSEGQGRTPFLLLLRGPRGNALSDGLYRVDIEDGPSLDLFLIPVLTSGADHQNYQSVFN